MVRLVEAIASNLRGRLEDFVTADDDVRCKWEIIDLVLAILVGCVRFRLLYEPRGLEAIDDYECREWLRLNGASRALARLCVRARAVRSGARVRRWRSAAAGAGRRSGAARIAAHVLHLPRRVLLEDARRHGRRRVRAVLRGAEAARRALPVLSSPRERQARRREPLGARRKAVRRGARVRRAGQDPRRAPSTSRWSTSRVCRAGPRRRTSHSSSTASGCSARAGSSSRTGIAASRTRRRCRWRATSTSSCWAWAWARFRMSARKSSSATRAGARWCAT